MAEDILEDFEVGSNDENPDIPVKWKNWLKADIEHSEKWRKDAKEDFDFVAGRQWDEDDKRKLESELRPVITFNRTEVIIDAVSGNEINNRHEVRYIPREEGDAIVNEAYTEAARWFDDESEANDEDSEAFRDSVICGMGWTDTLINFDDDPDGQPVVDRMDPLEMYWDNATTKGNLKDARRIWQIRKMDIEEAMELLPGVKKEDLDVGKFIDGQDDSVDPHVDEPEHYYENDSASNNHAVIKSVRLVRMQHWVWDEFYKVADPMQGKVVEMPTEEFETLRDKMATLGMRIKGVKMRRKKYKQAFIGRKVLSYGDAPSPKAFSLNCITGKYDRNQKSFYGLVRAMKDPQRWANKWMSQLLHIMNTNSKGGAFYESGIFVDQVKAERDWAKPDALIELKAGALINGRLKERGMGEFPQGYQLLTEFAIRAIRDVTGVSLEMLGMREQNQPGVLEAQRKQAGMAVLAKMFNSFKRYRRRRGVVMLGYIEDFLADGRLIKIIGQEKAQYMPLIKQANVKFDIIVDDQPTSPNQKEQIWNSLVQILPGIKDILPPKVMLELLNYSPLPASVVDKIKAVVNAPNPEAEKERQLIATQAIIDQTLTQAQVDKTKTEAAENQSQVKLNQAKVDLTKAQAITEIAGNFDEPT